MWLDSELRADKKVSCHVLAQSCSDLPIPCPNKWFMVAIWGLSAE